MGLLILKVVAPFPIKVLSLNPHKTHLKAVPLLAVLYHHCRLYIQLFLFPHSILSVLRTQCIRHWFLLALNIFDFFTWYF